MRKLLHLMWLNRSNIVPTTAVSLDAEKVFDRLEWAFLFSLPGFGPDFCKCIGVLYSNPKATVFTNGIMSPFFCLSRGTRQGCSLSPPVYHHFRASCDNDKNRSIN